MPALDWWVGALPPPSWGMLGQLVTEWGWAPLLVGGLVLLYRSGREEYERKASEVVELKEELQRIRSREQSMDDPGNSPAAANEGGLTCEQIREWRQSVTALPKDDAGVAVARSASLKRLLPHLSQATREVIQWELEHPFRSKMALLGRGSRNPAKAMMMNDIKRLEREHECT